MLRIHLDSQAANSENWKNEGGRTGRIPRTTTGGEDHSGVENRTLFLTVDNWPRDSEPGFVLPGGVVFLDLGLSLGPKLPL